MTVCWLEADSVRMRSGSRLCFHQTFYLLFPHVNCSSWSYPDRFGPRNINSEIKETNRQQQHWGNKYDMQVVNTVLLSCGVWMRLDDISVCWCVCVHTPLGLCVHYRVLTVMCRHLCMRVHGPDCSTHPTVAPAGVCCIPVCTADRDFHSQRPADGMYMCQPLQQITNPPEQRQNVPLSFCNFQYEEEAVGHLR